MGRKRTGRRSRTANRTVRRGSKTARRGRTRTARRGRARTARRGRTRTARKEREEVEESPRMERRGKKTRRSGKKKMNAYMQALQKARKSDAESFEYKGKKYVRKYAKTGMAIYKAA